MSEYAEGDLTALALAATTLHELFVSLVDAGFTKDEALAIVIGNLRGGTD
jgi:hypothetical protein